VPICLPLAIPPVRFSTYDNTLLCISVISTLIGHLFNVEIKQTFFYGVIQMCVATFAGGCFWCMVPPFKLLNGVISVVSGYSGGHTENPTYKEVCSGSTGHLEAVQIAFDPNLLSYDELLEVFWQQIDPTDLGGQFND
jgi:hypothetical protein